MENIGLSVAVPFGYQGKRKEKYIMAEENPDDKCQGCGVKRKEHFIMVHSFKDKEKGETK